MDDELSYDPTQIYLDLIDGGAVDIIPLTPDLWPSIISGAREIKGRLTAANHFTRDIDHWEMHPAGDELLVRLSGEFEIILEQEGVERRGRLDGAMPCCLVPRGTWHTIKVREAGALLFVTPGAGTEHRPA
jgi:hypothetical protein